MKYPRSWLKILWLGWLISCVLFLILWKQTHSSRRQSVLSERLLKAEEAVDQLTLAFHSLERLPFLLLSSSLEEAQRGSLESSRLAQFRAEASPHASIHWLKPDGVPVLIADVRSPQSDWLIPLIERRLTDLGNSVEVLRPAPAGMEVGRQEAHLVHLPEGTPDNYLLWCARDSGGNFLICEMNLEFVFRDWLKSKLHRLGLGSAEIALMEAGSPTPEKATLENPSSWSFRVPTFFADSPRPMDELHLRIDNSAVLSDVGSNSLVTLFFGALTLGGLALAILFSDRALRREAEFVEAKSKFTAMVGHELRTPISAMCMYSEILVDGLIDDTEKVSQYHSILKTESHKLKGLVENLLSLGTLEQGALKLKTESIRLRELLEEARGSETRIHGTVLLEEFPPNLCVVGDPTALFQVVSNLIANGLKYGDEKHPLVIAVEDDERSVGILFKDRGPGVSAEDQESIFLPYRRAGHPNPAKPGLGLGLALVDGLMRGMNGRVQVLTREGGGSVFKVTLPKELEKGPEN